MKYRENLRGNTVSSLPFKNEFLAQALKNYAKTDSKFSGLVQLCLFFKFFQFNLRAIVVQNISIWTCRYSFSTETVPFFWVLIISSSMHPSGLVYTFNLPSVLSALIEKELEMKKWN